MTKFRRYKKLLVPLTPLSEGETPPSAELKSESISVTFIWLAPKNKYGKIHYYPACYFSKLLCAVLNAKTLSISKQDILRKFGIEIIIHNN